MTPRYACCPSYEGEPHTEDCPAVAEIRRQDAEFRAECEGHPSGPYDAMGVTVYCDGSCRRIARRVIPGAMGATEDAT